MAACNENEGAANNQAWTVFQNASAGSIITQQAGYVNFTKISAASTARWAWVRPATTLADLAEGLPYSIEVKARVHPIGIADEGSFFEANQIALRLGEEGVAAPVYLKYGNGVNSEYVSTTSGGTQNVYRLNTSQWQVYRWVFHSNHLKYDIYLDGVEEPLFENVEVVTTSDRNGIYFGAESYHRCNIDVEYVKMRTGVFYGKSKIASVSLSAAGQGYDKTQTIIVSVHTLLMKENEKLLVSLVDEDDTTVVDAEEVIISQNKAAINFTIPAGLPRGKYYVKAAAPGGKTGDTDIAPQKVEYLITSSAFEGKNLATFGNSITSAANSWAYQVHRNLRFGNLYNGAVSTAVWHKQERTVAGQTIRTQNYYDADFAGMLTSVPADGNILQNQQRINNCAIVHLQKYFIDLDNKVAPTPDVIIFSYGTNDEVINMGNAETALQGNELNQVDIFTLAGALRWSIDTLKIKFPNAEIYVALPLQSTRSGKNDDNLKKIEVIKSVCAAKSVPYFDCYNEAGITVENATQYLEDGLHPNEAGKVVHGAYITRKLEEAADNTNDLPFVSNKDSSEEIVDISASMLNAGQNLSITTVTDKLSLSEVALYSITGKEVYRTTISGNEYSFNVPTTVGLYILNVKLTNNTSKEFKIQIK